MVPAEVVLLVAKPEISPPAELAFFLERTSIRPRPIPAMRYSLRRSFEILAAVRVKMHPGPPGGSKK